MCIRDRGICAARLEEAEFDGAADGCATTVGVQLGVDALDAVSYTHLTLPTSDLV